MMPWPLMHRDLFPAAGGLFLVYFLLFLFSPWLVFALTVLIYTLMDGVYTFKYSNYCIRLKK